MTIHSGHPFPTPDDPVRRLRGRQGGTVSLWTAGDADERAGLTVTSWMVAGGEPGRVLALLDPDDDLTELLLGTGRGVVQLLGWDDRGLADAFAGTAPAPGGPWRTTEWVATDHGPRLAGATSWALVTVETDVEVGWSRLVTCTLDEVVVGADDRPLVHRRGRYVSPEA
ncbi:flavin reductase (DIM6/NTAB) family NADH-FMN oxidoreductase RutF [Nocardioides cavernae]|uniref:Flavin reductase (DIM6/NTAB) family NADH-FMN oxidoreductase RutF n=1 Tax=Nocardioides cavernae TaxID=1921566 RepID=A0A7Y9KTQ9_9ACTN|nr:flavin reductase family protein [Nocardioides cavernae]NYE38924.1 flavin reductase (DIM6/NTAB) family NADH-FMN oxidoreductase RutF [Nocardioides cavernae]